MGTKFGLIILDGWGIGDGSSSDAITQASTPCMDALLKSYPSATLLTCGEHVGLPDGQMGNSEVGHLNIGGGRIVYQELTRINTSIRKGDFFENETLIHAFQKAVDENCAVHFMGLVSDGGVHSSQDHLHALCKMATDFGVQNAFIHAFTDGRDCDPNSGLSFIQKLEENISDTPVRIASVIGRYYAMDRDNRWERIKEAYDLLVHGRGDGFHQASEAIQSAYDNGITDEFIRAAVMKENGKIVAKIQEGDVVICFNFRTDRPREISLALTQRDFPDHGMKALSIHYVTMTNYDKTFNGVNIVFEKDNLANTLGEVLSKAGKTQVRIAETEKYPHVTFFFNGGRETVFEGEDRILVNSPKVATYDLQPEMSAPEVRDSIIAYMREKHPDFICLNFANPDMVGHTGVFEAIVDAVQAVDGCLRDVLETGQELGYEFLVIADHGNADVAINEDGSPNTAHSLNPVPVVLVTNENIQLNSGILADVAPTILERMQVAAPDEMDGRSLIG